MTMIKNLYCFLFKKTGQLKPLPTGILNTSPLAQVALSSLCDQGQLCMCTHTLLVS